MSRLNSQNLESPAADSGLDIDANRNQPLCYWL
jgi:hypothetical protein